MRTNVVYPIHSAREIARGGGYYFTLAAIFLDRYSAVILCLECMYNEKLCGTYVYKTVSYILYPAINDGERPCPECAPKLCASIVKLNGCCFISEKALVNTRFAEKKTDKPTVAYPLQCTLCLIISPLELDGGRGVASWSSR